MLIFLICFLIFTNNIMAQTGLVTDNAMVVSAREEASKIGIEIMKMGGNT